MLSQSEIQRDNYSYGSYSFYQAAVVDQETASWQHTEYPPSRHCSLLQCMDLILALCGLRIDQKVGTQIDNSLKAVPSIFIYFM